MIRRAITSEREDSKKDQLSSCFLVCAKDRLKEKVSVLGGGTGGRASAPRPACHPEPPQHKKPAEMTLTKRMIMQVFLETYNLKV